MVTTIRRVQVVWGGVEGSPFYTNLYFDAGVGGVEDVQGATSTFMNALSASVATPVTWAVSPEVQLIDTATGMIISVAIASVSGSGGGSRSVEALPPATQGLIRLRTGVYTGGREIRGRLFVPQVPGTFNVDGKPSSDYIIDVQDAYDLMIADVDATPVVWSPSQGVAEPVVVASVWDEFAVLRSRRD